MLLSIVMFVFSGIAFAEHDPDKAVNHSIILPPEIKEKTFDEFMEWCTPYYGEKCIELGKKRIPIILSPLKQFHSGVPYDEILCHEDLELVQKYDGSPACVKPETKRILIERGWTQDSSASNIHILRYSPVVFKGTGMEITVGQLSFEDLQKLEQRKYELDMLLDNKTISEKMSDERKMIQHYAQLAFDEKIPWELVKILWEKKGIVIDKVDDIDRDRFPIVSLAGISIGFDAYSVEEQYAGKPTAIKIGILKEKFTKETLERTDRMLRESVGDEIDIIYYKSGYIASYSR